MDGPKCAWGPRLHIRKRFTHAQALLHTHTHTSPAFHSSRRRPFSLPGKRNPILSPIKHRLPHLTGRGQGPCPLTLVCQPVDSVGGSPTFPCPSALLTGAGRQGTPPPPHSCPSAHLMDVGGWGGSPEPLNRGAGASLPWVGAGRSHLPVLVDGWGGPRSQLLRRLTGSYGPPALIHSHASADGGSCRVISDGRLDRRTQG